MFGKIIRLPFYFLGYLSVILIPIFVIVLLAGDFTVEYFLLSIAILGTWPMWSVLVSASLIEQFMRRKLIQTKSCIRSANELIGGVPFWGETISAHERLLLEVKQQETMLGSELIKKAYFLSWRHKALSRAILYGLSATFLSGLVIAYISNA